MESFDGKVGVVTGAASGIGRALAAGLAAEGMRLVLADVEASALDAAVEQFRSAGHTVEGVVADVSSVSVIGPMETGNALTLKAIWICAIKMMSRASHDALGAASATIDGTPFVAIQFPCCGSLHPWRVV